MVFLGFSGFPWIFTYIYVISKSITLTFNGYNRCNRFDVITVINMLRRAGGESGARRARAGGRGAGRAGNLPQVRSHEGSGAREN